MMHSSVARLARLIVIVSILFSAIPIAPASAARLGTKSANVEPFAQPATLGTLFTTFNTLPSFSEPRSTLFQSPLPPPPAPISPTLDLALTAEPEAVAPGDVVTFTV
jgi:hypothetical protein